MSFFDEFFQKGIGLALTHMLARVCLFASVATASATLELTPENWQAEVTDSGKSAFIK